MFSSSLVSPPGPLAKNSPLPQLHHVWGHVVGGVGVGVRGTMYLVPPLRAATPLSRKLPLLVNLEVLLKPDLECFSWSLSVCTMVLTSTVPATSSSGWGILSGNETVNSPPSPALLWILAFLPYLPASIYFIFKVFKHLREAHCLGFIVAFSERKCGMHLLHHTWNQNFWLFFLHDIIYF